MADKKISKLTEVTTLSDTSLITAVDLARSAGDENVKIQKSNLQTDLTSTIQQVLTQGDSIDVGTSINFNNNSGDPLTNISGTDDTFIIFTFDIANSKLQTLAFNEDNIRLAHSKIGTGDIWGTSIDLIENAVLIGGSFTGNQKGLVGQNDYSANYDDLTYVQKIYVDDKATYSATSTAITTLDCDTFDSTYQILTVNTDIQWSNTPASGKSFVKTLEIIGAFSLSFSTSTKVIGTYVDDGTTVNIITVNFANYPTVGLRTTVMINQ